MQHQTESDMQPDLSRIITILLGLSGLLLVVILGMAAFIALYTTSNFNWFEKKASEVNEEITETKAEPDDNFWHAPDINSVTDTTQLAQLKYGQDLIAHTADYFGPNGKVTKNSTNGMNCQNCHLEAGTKVFGNNYSAVFSTYPKYRARSGGVEDITKRVNDCFERSLNGKGLDSSSAEMKAIVAYIHFLGKDVPKGVKPEGSGFKDMAFLDRAIDPANGKVVYQQKCSSCHQANGEGQYNAEKSAFIYPPLWGANSYNDGAGLYRMSNFAKYVKYNMPLGVSHNNTQLSDEEAWDVAAFVNTQKRPKKDIRNDWPSIDEKPFDHPFGPYADGFSEKEHKFGPFKPIKAKLEELKKKKESAKKSAGQAVVSR
jgi:thiosulfate dehydrogenase